MSEVEERSGLKEAIELIQDKAIEASEVVSLDSIIENPRVNHVRIGTRIEEFYIPPPIRSHTVDSLEDLIAYAKDLNNRSIYRTTRERETYIGDDGDTYERFVETSKHGESPTAWHCNLRVQLVLNDADRRDAVLFLLSHSEKFRELETLREDQSPMSQQEFVRLIRFKLGVPTDFVNLFRRLEWRDGCNTAVDLQHGNSKLGRSIVSEVQGVDKLPDELRISVPVYNNVGLRQEYVVTCGIEIDTKNQQIMLAPMPDELERVTALAQDDIHVRLVNGLEGLNIPVFYGSV